MTKRLPKYLLLLKTPVRARTRTWRITTCSISLAPKPSLICITVRPKLLSQMDGSQLWASAGILSLVIGLGAKNLISDILAGLFIIFKGDFQVGDIVTIDGWRGTVQEIGLRTTKILSAGNDVKIFSNSSISGVINMTKDVSTCVCDVGIEYSESLERVESVLDKELPMIRGKLPSIVEGPFYKGVVELADSSVIIRIIATNAAQDCH